MLNNPAPTLTVVYKKLNTTAAANSLEVGILSFPSVLIQVARENEYGNVQRGLVQNTKTKDLALPYLSEKGSPMRRTKGKRITRRRSGRVHGAPLIRCDQAFERMCPAASEPRATPAVLSTRASLYHFIFSTVTTLNFSKPAPRIEVWVGRAARTEPSGPGPSPMGCTERPVSPLIRNNTN